MFEHSAWRPRVQTASSGPANVNALKKTCVIPIISLFLHLISHGFRGFKQLRVTNSHARINIKKCYKNRAFYVVI